MAAIPIDFRFKGDYKCNPKYFYKNFLDGYVFCEEKNAYFLKENLLVDNYQSFLKEFHDLIDEQETFEEIPVANFNDFEVAFDEDKRNKSTPFLYKYSRMFSFLGGESHYYWLFYDGSYKAYLEEYKTLVHFERILNKTMKNPLASFIKIGIFG